MTGTNLQKPEKLIMAERFSDEGLFKEVLELLDEIETSGELTDGNRDLFFTLKMDALYRVERDEEAIELAERVIREHSDVKSILLLCDALFIKTVCLKEDLKSNELDETILWFEKLLDQISAEAPEAPFKIAQRTIAFNYLKAMQSNIADDFLLGLEYIEKNREIAERYDYKRGIMDSLLNIAGNSVHFGKTKYALKCCERAIDIQNTFTKRYYPRTFLVLALIYSQQGNFNQAIKYYNEESKIAAQNGAKRSIERILNLFGDSYKELGELETAKEYLERALVNWKDRESDKDKAYFFEIFGTLFEIAYEMNDLDEMAINSQHCTTLVSEMNMRTTTFTDGLCLIEAMMLKKSTRTVNRAKAQEMFKELVDKKISFWYTTRHAFLHLSEMLLDEFTLTGENEVLIELQNLLSQFLESAKKQNQFNLHAEILFLQGKMALLSLDLKAARILLTQAQKLADTHNLPKLAGKISIEHDKLLHELNTWKKMEEENAPMKERIRLARIADQMGEMRTKRIVTLPSQQEEKPVLLLIITGGGIPLFTKTFTEEWTFDDNLFSSFLTAMNSFSSEIFSDGFDRAKFGNHTVIMKEVAPFRTCYVFEGQSYSAGQKLIRFTGDIKEKESIWQTLNEFNNRNMIINSEDNSPLHTLISDIFLPQMSN